MAYVGLKNFDAAINQYDQAISANHKQNERDSNIPILPALSIERAYILIKAGKPEALSELERLTTLDIISGDTKEGLFKAIEELEKGKHFKASQICLVAVFLANETTEELHAPSTPGEPLQ